MLEKQSVEAAFSLVNISQHIYTFKENIQIVQLREMLEHTNFYNPHTTSTTSISLA